MVNNVNIDFNIFQKTVAIQNVICTTFTFRRGPNARQKASLWKARRRHTHRNASAPFGFCCSAAIRETNCERRPISAGVHPQQRAQRRNRWRRGHQQITWRAAFARSRLEGEMWIFAVYLRWPNAKTGVANGGARTGRMRGQSLPGHTPRQKTRPANRSAANQIFTGAPSLKITVGRPLLAKVTRSGLNKQTVTQSRASSPETIMVLSQSEALVGKAGILSKVFETKTFGKLRRPLRERLLRGGSSFQTCSRKKPHVVQRAIRCLGPRILVVYAGGRVTVRLVAVRRASQAGAALKTRSSMQLPRFRSQASTLTTAGQACLGNLERI
ncbi:Hypothetical_protein [Hexamita inflata]|uniref:Hypothetical_protein n=1 Tax=Hexamita inflata TaxID=28002 RepID=A0AA86NCF3_9EUKA|nr:Hypothetical protein HINF_LOCUS4423 [Hexamita inflata]